MRHLGFGPTAASASKAELTLRMGTRAKPTPSTEAPVKTDLREAVAEPRPSSSLAASWDDLARRRGGGPATSLPDPNRPRLRARRL